MYIPRDIEFFIKRVTRQFPVLLVTGARQVGKTTLLQHLSANTRTYVTLDDPLLRELAQRDPALFLERFTPPVLIDEIQYAPQLLPLIKMAVDRKKKAGDFWLTGSQQFHLMQGVSESLAGRVGVIHLSGMAQRESEKGHKPRDPFLP
ncbi:MAG: AAA family ATPase, partial [Planctomycetes bacterium]|nr:AAA family ATPase [Planctomycetota bacterium]